MRAVAFLGLLYIFCAVGAQDYEIFVSDAGGFANGPWQILKYDSRGENPQVFSTDVGWPQDFIFLEDAGEVLISNFTRNSIDRYDLDTGERLGVFASNLSAPTRMRIGDDGFLYVLQWSGDGLVRRYQVDGTFVDNFTNVAVGTAIGMDWDDDGNFYVSSFNDATVRRFDANGADQGLFINTSLQGPTNIRFDANGNLQVLDWQGGAIRLFDSAGLFIQNFATDVVQPEGIAVLPSGNILVGNGGPGSIREYEANGDVVGNLVAPGSGGLIQPNAIGLRSLGEPFVLNAGLNDAWFDPATPGQGFLISVFPDVQQVFLAWFTFDTESSDVNAAMLGGASQRWLTAQGPISGNAADMAITVTTGGVFNAGEPMVNQITDGTITLRFEDCEAGTVSYQIDSVNLTGDIPIQRVAPDNIALCEALTQPAK